MQYFEGLTEEKAIKARYKELAKQYHPDRGGNAETMKEINNQYERVLSGAYQRAGKSLSEIDALLAKDIAAAQALYTIISIPDLNIELCGCWIWVTGNTRAARDPLKQGNFRWSSPKKAWYWRPPESAGKRKYKCGGRDMEWIRNNHGSLNLKDLKPNNYTKIGSA